MKFPKLLFLKQTLQDFHHTGSIAPSSHSLAKAITQPLQEARQQYQNLQVLEVGAGTGAFTQRILQLLRPQDHLDIYECNPNFAQILEKKLENRSQNIKIHVDYIQNLEKSNHYHSIICGLPFNNFQPETVKNILELLIHALQPNGTLSFFEYWAIRYLKTIFASSKEIKRLQQVGKTLTHYTKKYSYQRHKVLCNLPPAIAWHLKIPKSIPFSNPK